MTTQLGHLLLMENKDKPSDEKIKKVRERLMEEYAEAWEQLAEK